jgi:hypothetical protein
MRTESHVLVVGALSLVLPLCVPTMGWTAKVKPDRIDVGVVRVGAVVEAGVRVYWDRLEPGHVKPAAETPRFAVLKELTIEQTRAGRAYSEVRLVLRTAEEGEFKDVVRVSYGAQRAEFPVRMQVFPQEPGLRHVLIADTPFDSSSTLDANDFERWRRMVESAPLSPNYRIITKGKPVVSDFDLTHINVILLAESGVIRLLPEDIERLHEFADAGGRVILIGTRFMRGTIERINDVVAQRGMMIADTEFRLIENRPILLDGNLIRRERLTQGVLSVSFERPSPITVTDPSRATLIVSAVDGSEGGYVVRGFSGRGEFVVLTGSLWWFWINDDHTDNARLLQNLLTMPIPAD